ncbi:NAD-binding protein [Halorussus litoreus]|uniref:NAD-binding protein n=1 Tax=Halorussus litoreus TaxID=1710536 RepID=UPI000E27ADA1|nr:NAD-binding protein [Halorussus litoreus]
MVRNGSAAGIISVVGSATGPSFGRRERALVVGGGHVGRAVASHLNETYDAAFLGRHRGVVERTAREGVAAHHAEEIDARALDDADATDASLVVVAVEDAATTLLVVQLLRTRFDVPRVVIRVDDGEKVDSFDGLDVETVLVPDLVVDEVAERLEPIADEVADG